jgi:hypothetical protein
LAGRSDPVGPRVQACQSMAQTHRSGVVTAGGEDHDGALGALLPAYVCEPTATHGGSAERGKTFGAKRVKEAAEGGEWQHVDALEDRASRLLSTRT